MEFGVWTKGLATLGVDCLVLGVFEEAELSGEARSVDAACAGRLKALLERGDFAGRAGDTLLLQHARGLDAGQLGHQPRAGRPPGEGATTSPAPPVAAPPTAPPPPLA